MSDPKTSEDGSALPLAPNPLEVSAAIERAFDILAPEGLGLEESPPLPSPEDE